jgi:hypothetical protein
MQNPAGIFKVVISDFLHAVFKLARLKGFDKSLNPRLEKSVPVENHVKTLADQRLKLQV